ncbi:hypothetical protein XAC3810_510002 [Xanthomonas citri pv. citri]|nr:hypothetical protein XAC3810_510002 [Xanthomonas citri pv. citri]CEE45772.1 hypothetical protein XAC908_750002 [Xanthomonas citri pv. citri]CEF20141.1 hypothetical protein XACJK2_1080007 [Xanthomonas citri pv. citri]CEF37357.1 hypothetical protein XAC40_690010 [Xanthomonas citri pv. citri]CEH45342.1 hypothetical protein XACLE3_4970001 [Xanthomonas citri pv. citri]
MEAELARLKRMYAELALIITRSRTFCRERLSQTSRLQLGMAMIRPGFPRHLKAMENG